MKRFARTKASVRFTENKNERDNEEFTPEVVSHMQDLGAPIREIARLRQGSHH